jgi:hypothetical protein
VSILCYRALSLIGVEQNLIWPVNSYGFAADSVIIENSQAVRFLLPEFISEKSVSDGAIVLKWAPPSYS